MRTLNLYYQCNNNFVYALATSIVSLLIHASEEIQYDIYILTPDITVENQNRIKGMPKDYPKIHCRIVFMDSAVAEEEIRSWNVPAHRFAYVTYYKLLIARYFENTDVHRIMTVGADTLILGDLSELLDFDFHGNPIAMNWSEKLYERRFRRDMKYCIAEMVYFDLDAWRAGKCEERVINRLKKYGDIHGSKDQGLLNMEFQKEITQLPLKYNVYGITWNYSMRGRLMFNNAPVVTKEEVEDAYAHPEIVHLPATFLYRPHEEGTLHPMKEIWWEYCHKTPWRDMKPLPVLAELGAKEKFLRAVYTHSPRWFAEWFFSFCRHGYGFMNSVLYPYRETYGKNIKQIYTEVPLKK